MATINLYRIDSAKKELCLQELINSDLKLKDTINKTVTVNELEYEFGVTLYLERSEQGKDEISWNWILEEYGEEKEYMFKAAKAVLLIEETVCDLEKTYAVTFGSAFFKIDKFCDRDFGFDFASRLEYDNVKTTTLTAHNLKRKKTINTYADYTDLEFDSGESFSKLKVDVKIQKDFNLYKKTIEIGTSIRFATENESVENIINIILDVEKTLLISENDPRYHRIPLFKIVKDDQLLNKLNDSLNSLLEKTFFSSDQIISSKLLTFPELEIIGADEILSHTDDMFDLKYKNSKSVRIQNLSIDTIREFCKSKNIESIKDIDSIKIIRHRDNITVVTHYIKNIIEYTNDENNCIFSKGKWSMYNQDYIEYLENSLSKITIVYNKDYDYYESKRTIFIDKMCELEKNKNMDDGKSEADIKTEIQKKYYPEFWFNTVRAENSKFENHDRKYTSKGYESMDLYETETETMFAVKIGKASSGLCYAVDQSLTSLKMYQQENTDKKNKIRRVGLWFVLDRKTQLEVDRENKIDLRKLKMLMLKIRIDQWKKQVRLAGLEPVIYINYKSED